MQWLGTGLYYSEELAQLKRARNVNIRLLREGGEGGGACGAEGKEFL